MNKHLSTLKLLRIRNADLARHATTDAAKQYRDEAVAALDCAIGCVEVFEAAAVLAGSAKEAQA